MNGNNLNNYKMESSIMDNGVIILDVVTVNKFGKTDPFTKEIGKMIWRTDKAD